MLSALILGRDRGGLMFEIESLREQGVGDAVIPRRGRACRSNRGEAGEGPRQCGPSLSLEASQGVSRETNWLAWSVASVLVNIVRNWPPAGDRPT